MIPQRKTNPLHHNAGRLPNFNQSLSQHLSFANMSCKGFAGNILQAERLLSGELRAPEFQLLPEYDCIKLADIKSKLRMLSREANDLAADIAEFNRDKTKLVLPKTERATHHHLVKQALDTPRKG